MELSEAVSTIDKIVLQLQTLREELLAGDPALPQEALRLIAEERCLSCTKPYLKKRIVRGCHESCQKAIKRKIDAGVLTDAEAIRKGLMTPKDPGGRPNLKGTRLEAALSQKGLGSVQTAAEMDDSSVVESRQADLAAESREMYNKVDVFEVESETTRKKKSG